MVKGTYPPEWSSITDWNGHAGDRGGHGAAGLIGHEPRGHSDGGVAAEARYPTSGVLRSTHSSSYGYGNSQRSVHPGATSTMTSNEHTTGSAAAVRAVGSNLSDYQREIYVQGMFADRRPTVTTNLAELENQAARVLTPDAMSYVVASAGSGETRRPTVARSTSGRSLRGC